MKIKARIEIQDEHADLAAIPLMQDNTASMRTVVVAQRAVTYIKTEQLGTLIASVDDYLLNAKVALEMVNLAVENPD
ncbi:MAG TPA: hypothetical protein ENN68_09280 [Methanomicrobia archaeon]|nr:hypothetical protein [Methanomicrobia archaeon]